MQHATLNARFRFQSVLLFAALAVVSLNSPSVRGVCLSQSLLGLECPGCGVLRGLVALAALDFALAARLNAAVFLVVPALALQILPLLQRARGRVPDAGLLRLSVTADIVMCASLVLVWMARLLVFLPPLPT